MYKPIGDGIDKSAKSVIYTEERPPDALLDIVHCFWELKTQSELPESFDYHVLPDACVNLLFDQTHPDVTAVTVLQKQHKVLPLGNQFHFVGVELLPGVWQGSQDEIQSDLVDKAYLGPLPLLQINRELIEAPDFFGKQKVLAHWVQVFIDKGIVHKNETVAKILGNLADIKNVQDMADIVELSPRQLQRQIKKAVWLSPHDFLKILRVQQTFKEHYLDYYADQSHFIHSFRKVTGYTPKKYNSKFGV